MNYKLLTRNEVAEILNVSAATIDRLRRSGDFAPPVAFAGSVRWRDSDIHGWICNQIVSEDRR